MPLFPVVSEILSFVTTSVSVTYRVFYPQDGGGHFSRAKCLSMVMLTVRGNIVRFIIHQKCVTANVHLH